MKLSPGIVHIMRVHVVSSIFVIEYINICHLDKSNQCGMLSPMVAALFHGEVLLFLVERGEHF